MKKFISAMLLTLAMSVLSYSVVLASYTSTIDSFTYNGYYIPAYDGDVYEEINGNEPKFTSTQFTQDISVTYGELDSLGRVTTCYGNLDHTLFPTGECGNISSVYPTGWVQAQYDFINGKYLYYRSNLIMWALTGQNANKQNLMTGTRTFNTIGMLTYENKVLNYLKEDEGNNVLYRVTPVFKGNDLLASGLIMEAESVDDLGAKLKFAIFVYNVEPGVEIDYATGKSRKANSDENINYFNDIKGLKYQSIKSIKTKTIKYKKIKKKKISFSLKAKAPSQKLKYKVIKYPKGAKKFITVSKTGKVTLKKKAKKGTYAIKITAIANKTYAESKKIVKIKVK